MNEPFLYALEKSLIVGTCLRAIHPSHLQKARDKLKSSDIHQGKSKKEKNTRNKVCVKSHYFAVLIL